MKTSSSWGFLWCPQRLLSSDRRRVYILVFNRCHASSSPSSSFSVPPLQWSFFVLLAYFHTLSHTHTQLFFETVSRRRRRRPRDGLCFIICLGVRRGVLVFFRRFFVSVTLLHLSDTRSETDVREIWRGFCCGWVKVMGCDDVRESGTTWCRMVWSEENCAT